MAMGNAEMQVRRRPRASSAVLEPSATGASGRRRLAGSPPRLQQHYVGTTLYLVGAGPPTWALP